MDLKVVVEYNSFLTQLNRLKYFICIIKIDECWSKMYHFDFYDKFYDFLLYLHHLRHNPVNFLPNKVNCRLNFNQIFYPVYIFEPVTSQLPVAYHFWYSFRLKIGKFGNYLRNLDNIIIGVLFKASYLHTGGWSSWKNKSLFDSTIKSIIEYYMKFYIRYRKNLLCAWKPFYQYSSSAINPEKPP